MKKLVDVITSLSQPSLSSVTLIACSVAMLIEPGLYTTAGFGLALLNFNAKKVILYLRAKKDLKDLDRLVALELALKNQGSDLDDRVRQLSDQVNRLNAVANIKTFSYQANKA